MSEVFVASAGVSTVSPSAWARARELGRRAVRDVAVDDDERRPIRGLLERGERTRQRVEIVGVADAQDIPAVAEKTRGDIFGEGEPGIAFDGDLVVVVDPAQIRKREMARQ